MALSRIECLIHAREEVRPWRWSLLWILVYQQCPKLVHDGIAEGEGVSSVEVAPCQFSCESILKIYFRFDGAFSPASYVLMDRCLAVPVGGVTPLKLSDDFDGIDHSAQMPRFVSAFHP